MSRLFPVSRRTVLRGAGLSLAVPCLEAMSVGRAAVPAFPKRIVVFYTPGGTVIESWRPTGTETNFQMGPILSPLEPIKKQITVLDGLEIQAAREGYGHPHTRGMAGLLTGRPTTMGPYETCGGKSGFPTGPSVDQVIAAKIGGATRLPSLQVAVRWPTMFYGGARVSPTNIISYGPGGAPIPPETDPRAVWSRLFKDANTSPDQLASEHARSGAILDTVGASYRRLAARLPAADRQRLEEHATKVEEIRASIDSVMPAGAACHSDFGADLEGQFASASKVDVCDGCVEQSQDTLIPRTGKIMMDLVSSALACDLTRVVTIQWADLAANNSFPWLGLNDTHHGYQHDRGYQPDGIAKIDTWYATQFKYFLDQLAAYPEGAGTVLDNTVVFWCKEISHPNNHTHTEMPFVLGGGAGGSFRTGRWLKSSGASNSDLLVSFLNAFDIQVGTFGTPDYCKGPLAGLV